QYAGLSPVGRAKDQNASLLDNPVSILYDTERSVFPFELIEQVAKVQESRSVTPRPSGSVEVAPPSARTRLLRCAQCERNARDRHAEGSKCGCKSRSVFTHVIEDDFKKLIGVLSIKEDKLPLLVEMAIQAEQGGPHPMDDDIEQQKQAAIAKLRRKIDAARDLFADGDLTREEYLNRK